MALWAANFKTTKKYISFSTIGLTNVENSKIYKTFHTDHTSNSASSFRVSLAGLITVDLGQL